MVIKKPIKIFLLLVLIFDLLIWRSLASAWFDKTAIYFLDVGQGDSQLISFKEGARFIIDGGPDASILKGLGKILPMSERYIDLLILSHPETDHMDGFIEVVNRFRVGAVIWNGRGKETADWQEFSGLLRDKQIPVIALREGDKIRYGDDKLSILSPGDEFINSDALNDTALVSLLQSDGARLLFTADIGSNVEDYLIKKYDLRADILKVGHHGSKYSSSPEFLEAVRPKVSVIQVGAHNKYGHPTKEALARLKDIGTSVYRNDWDGLVKIILNGESLSVEKER